MVLMCTKEICLKNNAIDGQTRIHSPTYSPRHYAQRLWIIWPFLLLTTTIIDAAYINSDSSTFEILFQEPITLERPSRIDPPWILSLC